MQISNYIRGSFQLSIKLTDSLVNDIIYELAEHAIASRIPWKFPETSIDHLTEFEVGILHKLGYNNWSDYITDNWDDAESKLYSILDNASIDIDCVEDKLSFLVNAYEYGLYRLWCKTCVKCSDVFEIAAWLAKLVRDHECPVSEGR